MTPCKKPVCQHGFIVNMHTLWLSVGDIHTYETVIYKNQSIFSVWLNEYIWIFIYTGVLLFYSDLSHYFSEFFWHQSFFYVNCQLAFISIILRCFSMFFFSFRDGQIDALRNVCGFRAENKIDTCLTSSTWFIGIKK